MKQEITLSAPITRNGEHHYTIELRSPKFLEIANIDIEKLLAFEATAVRTVLPIISTPSLTRQEIDAQPLHVVLAIKHALESFRHAPEPIL